MRKSMILIVTVLMVAIVLSAVSLAGCKTTVTAETADAAETAAASIEAKDIKDVKFVYICKKLTDDWFKLEDQGMKKKADELGVQYNGIDADYKDERNMQAVDNVIAQEISGVAICATNQGLGSSIAKKFKEAKIPYLSVDDTLLDENGNPVPYVGVPTKTAGIETGQALVAAAKKKDFFAEGNDWKIMIVEMAQITTTHEMALGYQEEFKKSIDGITDERIVFVDAKTGSFDDSIAAVSAAFNANPGVTHWIFATVDDYPAFATVKMLGENSFDFKNVLVSGFGAYQPSIDIFTMGGDIADSYMSMDLDPEKEGETAIQFLYDKVVNGKEIPMETRIGGSVVDISTWKE